LRQLILQLVVELEPASHNLQLHPPQLYPFLLLLPELLVFLLLLWLQGRLLQLWVVLWTLVALLWKQCRHGLQLETWPVAEKQVEALP